MEFLLTSALAEEAQEVAKAEPTWAEEAVKKFAETPGTVWIAVGVLVALGVILLAIGKTSKKWTAKTVAFGALAWHRPRPAGGPGLRRAAIFAGRLVCQCVAVLAGLSAGLRRAGPGGHCEAHSEKLGPVSGHGHRRPVPRPVRHPGGHHVLGHRALGQPGL